MKRNDIAFEVMDKSLFYAYQEQIINFNCDGERFSDGLNQRLQTSLDNDVTTLIFFDTSANYNIIGYCSYCCASAKVNGEIFPAVEIVNFAHDNAYQDLYFDEDNHLSKENKMPCAAFTFRFCINWIENICRKHIHANFIILFAEGRQRLVNFYSRNLFDVCPAGYYFLRPSSDYAMIHVINR